MTKGFEDAEAIHGLGSRGYVLCYHFLAVMRMFYNCTYGTNEVDFGHLNRFFATSMLQKPATTLTDSDMPLHCTHQKHTDIYGLPPSSLSMASTRLPRHPRNGA